MSTYVCKRPGQLDQYFEIPDGHRFDATQSSWPTEFQRLAASHGYMTLAEAMARSTVWHVAKLPPGKTKTILNP